MLFCYYIIRLFEMNKVIPEIFFVFFPNHFLYSSNFWLYCTYSTDSSLVSDWCLRGKFIQPEKLRVSSSSRSLKTVYKKCRLMFVISSWFDRCSNNVVWVLVCVWMRTATSTAVGGTGVGQLINFGEIEVVFAHFARTSKTQSSKSSCYISLYSGCWNIKLGK